MEEPLKYSKDVKTDSRRIVGVIFVPEERQPEVGGVTCIIDYAFQDVDDVLHITEVSVYCACPNIVRNLVDPVVLSEMVRGEIQNMEDKVEFHFKNVDIL